MFGEVGGGKSKRVSAIAELFDGAGFEARASANVAQDMWEKWVLLVALAGANCLLRASVGDVLAASGGRGALLSLLSECKAVAAASGHEPRPAFVAFAEGLLTTEGSPLVASMLRDIERGAPTEGEHVLGDLADRADRLGIAVPVLRLARLHVAAYEVRRGRK